MFSKACIFNYMAWLLPSYLTSAGIFFKVAQPFLLAVAFLHEFALGCLIYFLNLNPRPKASLSFEGSSVHIVLSAHGTQCMPLE